MSADEELALSILRKHLATSWYAIDDVGFLIDGNVTLTVEEAELVRRLVAGLPPDTAHAAYTEKYGKR